MEIRQGKKDKRQNILKLERGRRTLFAEKEYTLSKNFQEVRIEKTSQVPSERSLHWRSKDSRQSVKTSALKQVYTNWQLTTSESPHAKCDGVK